MDPVTIMRLNNCFENMCQKVFYHYGSCKDCDHKICCTADAPVVFNHEIEKIAKHIGMNVKKFKKKHIIKLNLPILNRRLRTPCIFLNDNRQCKIYNIRPKACRGFPFEVTVEMGIIRMESIYLCPIATLIHSEFNEFYDKHATLVPETKEMKEYNRQLAEANEKVQEMVNKSADLDFSHENDFMMTSPLFWTCFYHYKVEGIKNIEDKFNEYLQNPQALIDFVLGNF